MSQSPQTQQMCFVCSHGLVPDRWLQVDPPCGHGFHATCARRSSKWAPANEGNGASLLPTCHVCLGLLTSRADGLPSLEEQCTEAFRRFTPQDCEFWVTEEMRCGRRMPRLSQVPPVVMQLRGLRCLDFTGHPIVEIPDEIRLLARSLKRLVLISLRIQSLPDGVCDLNRLEQLLVIGNPMRKAPDRISNLSGLWDFYFDANMLDTLPPLPQKIWSLKVSGNLLKALPEDLGVRCPNIDSIRAYGNRLVSIPTSVCRLKLIELSLQGNDLRELPEAVGSISTLKFLSLHDNRLTLIPDSVCELKELRWLYLYGNQLIDLPKGLLRAPCGLERLFLEGNPLLDTVLMQVLGNVPDSLRTLGVDAAQVHAFKRSRELEANGRPVTELPLPQCVVSGWLLPWNRLYAKLIPASQLRRNPGVEAVSSENGVLPGSGPGEKDMLVVAFSASQAEPEWFGALSKVIRAGGRSGPRIIRSPVDSFDRRREELHGPAALRQPGSRSIPRPNGANGGVGGGGVGVVRVDATEANQQAISTAWLGSLCSSAGGGSSCGMADHQGEDDQAEAEEMEDFDMLSLCDTNAQWYYDFPGARDLGLEAKLTQVVSQYKRVLMLGVSMGGFGALIYSHLADAVLALGPQTDLTMSHLRPGVPPGELQLATQRLQRNVRTAVRNGTHVELHVAAEDHVAYARQVALGPNGTVIHAVDGRIARMLERADLLVPLLADTILGAKQRPRADRDAGRDKDAEEEPVEARCAWEWDDQEEKVLLACHNQQGRGSMSFCRISGQQLWHICRKPPSAGDWFCLLCRSYNGAKVCQCSFCGGGVDEAERCRVAEAPRRPPAAEGSLGRRLDGERSVSAQRRSSPSVLAVIACAAAAFWARGARWRGHRRWQAAVAVALVAIASAVVARAAAQKSNGASKRSART
eukprot:TRINITY_DN15468_c0_g1_i1.p1 TRINITY_DN15468_c0_g1~~TRINITY_DN15468_c0_g1_i1.p1  ORF type:complete len:919 (-),score=136.86 TRINITY_DN15468_c0_g1_i1:81-2837(-)